MMMEDERLLQAVRSGHLASLASYAGRQVLAAWDADDSEALTEAMVLLRDVLPDPPEDYDPRPWIAAQPWKTAKRGEQYVVLRASTDWRGQLVFIRWLRVTGYEEWFYGKPYRCRDIDGFHYWAMTSPTDTISNRRAMTSEQLDLGLGGS
jgi:hypothetical protein